MENGGNSTVDIFRGKGQLKWEFSNIVNNLSNKGPENTIARVGAVSYTLVNYEKAKMII